MRLGLKKLSSFTLGLSECSLLECVLLDPGCSVIRGEEVIHMLWLAVPDEPLACS